MSTSVSVLRKGQVGNTFGTLFATIKYPRAFDARFRMQEMQSTDFGLTFNEDI